MATFKPQQVLQVILVTMVFVFHLFTFYDLSRAWNMNIVMMETSIYGIYFIIVIGYVIAVVSEGNFTPPLEAMTKLYGAVFYNVLGLMTFRFYSEALADEGFQNNHHLFFGLMKSGCSLAVAILYYIEMFQA